MANYSAYSKMAPQFAELGSGSVPVFRQTGSFPAPYLPILELQTTPHGNQWPVVIKAGMLVGIDQYGWIVPATGHYDGSDGVTITYADNDVTYGVADLDEITTYAKNLYGSEFYAADTSYTAVESTGATTTKLVIPPIGVAESDMYAHPAVILNYFGDNYDLPNAAIITVGQFEYPVLNSDMAVVAGHKLIVANPSGDTFSAANVATIGRFKKAADVTAYTGGTSDELAASEAKRQDHIIGRSFGYRRIDNWETGLDKRGLAPDANFQESTASSPTTTDPKFMEHLRSAAKLTIDGVEGHWLVQVLIGRGV